MFRGESGLVAGVVLVAGSVALGLLGWGVTALVLLVVALLVLGSWVLRGGRPVRNSATIEQFLSNLRVLM